MGRRAWDIIMSARFIEDGVPDPEPVSRTMEETLQTKGEPDPIMAAELTVPGREGRLEVWFENTGPSGTVGVRGR
jgi:hypothetical protein